MFTTGPNETLPVRHSVTTTRLLVNSTGPAAEILPSYMGVYMRTEEVYNDFPVYRMVNGTEVLYVRNYGFWSLNTQTHPTDAYITHTRNNPTASVPSPSGWLYWDGSKWTDDNYLTVTARGNEPKLKLTTLLICVYYRSQ